jgi:hypothetical protein
MTPNLRHRIGTGFGAALVFTGVFIIGIATEASSGAVFPRSFFVGLSIWAGVLATIGGIIIVFGRSEAP